MTQTTVVRPIDSTLRSALWLAAAFALAKLLLQFGLTLYTSHLGYSYFRDEFYYLACGRHLAWGFVDHGPVVAVQARLGELLFGDSVFGIRVLSALAGAETVFLTGMIAWALGGQRPAQALAMLAVLTCPQYIAVDGFLSMNSFEAVFWMGCVWALLMLLRGSSKPLWWVVFGCSGGLGILNKPSMAFFLMALCFGLVCTAARRVLWSRWAAVGVALLLVIPLPYLVWQIHNHWPLLEFLENGRRQGKNVVLDPLHFFLAQFAMLGPFNALIWIPGLVALLRAKSIRQGRWLGLAYLAFYVMMNALHAKDYYLEGVYPALIAAGGVAWERRYALSRSVMKERVYAFPVLESVLLLANLLILPMASPVLPPALWVRYTQALHLRPPESETAATGPLPQFFADRFGWQQLTETVVSAYHALPAEDREQVCLVMTNYGEAGALDLLGRKMEPKLPPAVGIQNSYWMWGTHGCSWKVVILVTENTPQQEADAWNSVTLLRKLDDPNSMPFEHKNVYLLRDRKPSMPVVWDEWKDYI